MFTENEIQESEAIESTAKAVQLTQKESFQVPSTHVDYGSLDDAIESDISCGITYWTPTEVGEFKRGTLDFFEVQEREKIDTNTGEFSIMKLPVMVMQAYSGKNKAQICNGSKRLVAELERAVKNKVILIRETPIQIKYLGKVKNSTNALKSDVFEIKVLTPKNTGLEN